MASLMPLNILLPDHTNEFRRGLALNHWFLEPQYPALITLEIDAFLDYCFGKDPMVSKDSWSICIPSWLASEGYYSTFPCLATYLYAF